MIPQISVCIITYNQEKFIKGALNSILSQQTTFPFEVNVFDDCSTDNTGEVIKQIITEHPKGNLINYFRHPKNIGLRDNYVYSIEHCKGKYIAICEGDDYWIDNSKLQKQVDFLESHEDYYLTFHKAIRLNTVASHYSVYPETMQSDFTDKNFFKISTIPMASVVFRNTEKVRFSKDTIQLDFNLLCSLMSLGKARMFNEVMSVYRVHENATTYNRPAILLKQRIQNLSEESNYTEYSPVVRKEIGRLYGVHVLQLLKTYPKEVSKSEKLKYLIRFLSIPKTSGNYFAGYWFILKSIFS